MLETRAEHTFHLKAFPNDDWQLTVKKNGQDLSRAVLTLKPKHVHIGQIASLTPGVAGARSLPTLLEAVGGFARLHGRKTVRTNAYPYIIPMLRRLGFGITREDDKARARDSVQDYRAVKKKGFGGLARTGVGAVPVVEALSVARENQRPFQLEIVQMHKVIKKYPRNMEFILD